MQVRLQVGITGTVTGTARVAFKFKLLLVGQRPPTSLARPCQCHRHGDLRLAASE